jgi:site-specific DNA recombinase
MRKRAIIYARVSTEDQVEKYGLPSQLRACREYSAAHDLEVVEEISDEGISGVILDRAGLSRLRDMARAKAVDVVVMLDADRLSRELAHLLVLRKELDPLCRLEFVTGNFEDSPNGRMFFGIRGVIAQYERELTRERTMRGKRERAKSGLRVGGRVAMGYLDEAGVLVIDEARAATVRQMFVWHDSGVSLCEITRRLRASGVSTWSGKPWWYTAVRAILSNEVYAGIGHWGAERIVIPVPPLVSRELWERVQARLANNPTPNVGRPSVAYLLRGLLHCHCGRKMYGELAKSGSRRYPWYRCQARNKALDRLPYCGGSASAAKIDEAAWSAISEAFTDAERLRAIAREHEGDVRSDDPDRLHQLEGQAAKLRRREQAALGLLGDPDFSEDRVSIKRQYLDAQQERRRIEAEIAAGRRVTTIRAGSWVDEAADVIRRYIAAISTAEQRQEFVRGLVSRAEWTGEELKMACFIGPKSSSSLRDCVSFPALEVILTARLAA